MNGNRFQVSRADKGLGEDMLAGVLDHEVAPPLRVNCPADRAGTNGAGDNMDNVPFFFAHLNNLRGVEGALVTRLPAAPGVKTGPVQDDPGPAVGKGISAQHPGVELEPARLRVIQFFSHAYGIPTIPVLDKALDRTLS